jgi:hypothetical protein
MQGTAVMVDDRPEDTGPSAESARSKRAGPTIDLEATEVSGDARKAAGAAEPDPTPREPPERSAQRSVGVPVIGAAAAGASAAALVLGVAWFLGWNTASPIAPPPTDTTAIEGLAARVASVESRTNAPPAAVPDAAATVRIESLEKSSASLRAELAAARAQSDKLAGLVDELKSAPREPAPPAPDLSAINERLAQIERNLRAQGSEIAQENAKIAQENAKPADDIPLRRVVAASLLDSYVRQGDPYVAVLAAAKSLAADADALKPLDVFAASGVPNPATLCR